MNEIDNLRAQYQSELDGIVAEQNKSIDAQVEEYRQKIIASVEKTEEQKRLEEFITVLDTATKYNNVPNQIIPQQILAEPNYTQWDKDLGFLYLIIDRKTSISSKFDIDIFGKQLQNKNDFIHDKDIDGIVEGVVKDICESLSNKYKNYIIDKYFGDNKSLVVFITESVYDTLIRTSIDANMRKVEKQYSDTVMELVDNLNNKNKEK